MAESEGGYRVRAQVFHAGTPGELTEQVIAFLAELPAAFVRGVRFQTPSLGGSTQRLSNAN